MPVLDKEPELWPADLLDEGVEHGQWWALHVRPRTEKTLARRLRSRAFGYFLPQHERRKIYQRRAVISHVPLFPGYLFAYGEEPAHEFVLQAREVVNCLAVTDQDRFVAELRSIERMLRSGEPVTPEERLQVGMPARITKGPLAGLSGSVVRNKGGLRFVLQVQFIQRGASIEVDGAMIEAV